MVQARCISNLDQSGDCGDRKGEYDLEVKVAELGFPDGSVGKEFPCSAGDTGDVCSILGSGRSPGGGHGNPRQYSCLVNPMN